MNHRSSNTFFLIWFACLLLLFGCKREWDNPDDQHSPNFVRLPTVTTSQVSNRTLTTAQVGGQVVKSGIASVTERGVYWGAYPDVVSTGTKLAIGSGTGPFSHFLTGLIPGATYYVKAYATNSAGTSYGDERSFTTDDGQQTFTDTRDGHVYQKVIIGTQVWMAENLAYLPSVSPPSAGSDTEKHYYVYGYEGTSVSAAKQEANYSTYGVLYNWPAAMNGAASSTSVPSGVQGICPDGWHLPSDAEWTVLIDYLTNNGFGYGGSGSDIAKSMASTTGWNSHSTAGTVGNNQSTNNSSGFKALPGGYRNYDGGFGGLGTYADFWSASAGGATHAWRRVLNYGTDVVGRYANYKRLGFSVRCLQD